jgi:hypothetical protein
MKIDRAGGAPEIPQNNDPTQIQEGAKSPKGISEAPDGIEPFSRNANPFSQDSIFSNHEHQPHGRPFTDPSFHPGKAQGRPFQDEGPEEAISLEAATTEPAEAAPTDPAIPQGESTEGAEEAALPLNTNLPAED